MTSPLTVLERLKASALSLEYERWLLDRSLRPSQEPPRPDPRLALEGAMKMLIGAPPQVAAATGEALHVFWTAPASWKASALNVAGAGFFALGWYAEAVEHYVLATSLGMSPEDMRPNVAEVRAHARIDPSVPDRDLARTALVGRHMRQLLFEIEPVAASLMRAEMFERARTPTWARLDLLRVVRVNPAVDVASYRLLRVAAMLGDQEAAYALQYAPVAHLDATLQQRLARYVSTQVASTVEQPFGTLLARW